MDQLTVAGIYHDGKVELMEMPIGVESARVMVTFLPPDNGMDARKKEQIRQEAMERLFASMKKGADLGGGPYYTDREELYEERLNRFNKSNG